MFAGTAVIMSFHKPTITPIISLATVLMQNKSP